MKGIIFAGCSFTWGEGLELYSNLPTLPLVNIELNKYHFPDLGYYMPKSHKKYIEANRFSRLVTNYFETFDIVTEKNGGDIFTMKDHIDTSLIQYKNDISHVIIQLTENFRGIKIHNNCNKNCCEYDLVRIIEQYYDYKSGQKDNNSLYFTELLENELGNKDIYTEYLEKKSTEHFVSFIEYLKKINDSGIKICFIGSWHSQFNLLEKKKDKYPNLYNFYNNNLIPIKYNNQEYRTMSEFFSENELLIKNDFPFSKNYHPSKTAHRIIAESIIEYLKK
jgi:hypothetical protein